jgi:hypothetical protein
VTFTEAVREIESHNLAARLNVASDLKSFLRAAKEQEAIRIILRELDSQEKRQQILLRTIELSRQKIDPRYENQWDTALTLYVWLISLKDLELAKIVAEVAMQAPQCWWAKKISFSILLRGPVYTDASFQQHILALSSRINETTDSDDVILPTSYLSEVVGKSTFEIHSTKYRYNSTDFTSTKKWGLESFVPLDLFRNNGSIAYLNKTDALTI